MHRDAGSSSRILDAVEETNRLQKELLVNKLIALWGEDMKGKIVALWGLAFKPQTDDMREAPSIVIVNQLAALGAHLQVYDPIAMDKARRIFQDISFMPEEYEALQDADALLLITERRQFRYPDFARMKSLLKSPLILDGRNQYDPVRMQELGFGYYAIGRPSLPPNS